MDAMLLYVTWPDLLSAEAAADALLARKLIACANILPGATSMYWWNGAVERSQETLMLLKTRADLAAAARDAILALHPYDNPCVTAAPLDGGASSPAFLAWIASVTQ